MNKETQPNPIYERLTRHTRGPSMWLVITISIGIGLAVLVAALTSLDKGHLSGFILLAALAIDLLSPAVIAVYAANLTSKSLHQENWQMMKLAGITEGTIVKGYGMAAFHRLRLLAAIATALAPTLIMVITLAMLVIEHRRTSADTGLSGGFLVIFLPAVILLTVGLWFYQKVSGHLGASLAVSWKHPIPAMIVSSLTLLIFPPLAFISMSWSMMMIYMILAAVFRF